VSFIFVGKTGFEPANLPFSQVGMRYQTTLLAIKKTHYKVSFLFVGKTGFEPATPWSQTRCATGLRYFPNLFADPKRRNNFRIHKGMQN
jgi:hypothetical protein